MHTACRQRLRGFSRERCGMFLAIAGKKGDARSNVIRLGQTTERNECLDCLEEPFVRARRAPS
jgi:hypothetical protein